MPPSAAGTRLLARAAMHTPHSSNPAQSKKKSGADDPIRTDDLLITSELLYQLSYVGPRGARENLSFSHAEQH